MSPRPKHRERRMVLYGLGALVLAIVAVSILVPSSADDDPAPTTYNTGSAGAKAAYLLMQDLGLDAVRWSAPAYDLSDLDPAHTTLVLTEPHVESRSMAAVQAEIETFLSRGGHVLATGRAGAYLLPGGQTAGPNHLYKTLCLTAPDAHSASDPLAQAGSLSIGDEVAWSAPASPDIDIAQRCGEDAVVVRMRHGAGEAIWWSSPMPLTNRGLHQDASLKLVLASLAPLPGGPARRILFDEYVHGEGVSIWDTARGLPLWPLALQAALAAMLLVLSFGRRNGPLRMPVTVPRTSPIEFAESMGRLYRSAGATRAATGGARRRLLTCLGERCGVPRAALRTDSPDAILASLHARYGGEWGAIGEHLRQATEAEYATLAPRSALALVRALDRDRRDLAAATRSIPRTDTTGVTS
jgi:hypothetical protein